MRDIDLALQIFELEPSVQNANNAIQLLVEYNESAPSLPTAQQLLKYYLRGTNIPYQIKKSQTNVLTFIIPVYTPNNNSSFITSVIAAARNSRPRGYLRLVLQQPPHQIMVRNIIDYGETENPTFYNGNYLDLLKSLPEIIIPSNQDISNTIIDTIQNLGIRDNSNAFQIEVQSVTERIASFPEEVTLFRIDYRKYSSSSPIRLHLRLRRTPWRDFLEFRIHENISYRDINGDLHETLDMALSGPYARGIANEEETPHLPEWDRFLTIPQMKSLLKGYIEEIKNMNL